ncbi:MAG: hypothetical protein IBJ13_01450, partial [Sphingopyxis sp.]|nr:hypothetical protein [Sphingopyxis sp.]
MRKAGSLPLRDRRPEKDAAAGRHGARPPSPRWCAASFAGFLQQCGFDQRELAHHIVDVRVPGLAGAIARPADIGLAVDTNCPWSRAEARSVADQIKDLDILWLEEPLWPPDDFN